MPYGGFQLKEDDFRLKEDDVHPTGNYFYSAILNCQAGKADFARKNPFSSIAYDGFPQFQAGLTNAVEFLARQVDV
jgi:hypothetical protein